MKRMFLLLILVLNTSIIFSQNHSIIPCPVSYEVGTDGNFELSKKTIITVNKNDKELIRLAGLLSQSLNLQYFQDSIAIVIDDEKEVIKKYDNVIQFVLSSNGKVVDEGYQLTVKRNSILLHAPSYRGIFYGIQTFIQLIPAELTAVDSNSDEKSVDSKTALNDNNTTIDYTIKGCKIIDYPRFGYRGMHLDVCRHMFPVEFIKKYIDLMAFYKMNNFHWHLTDDQGWRLEIKKYPLLTQKGSWRSSTTIGRNNGQDSIPYGGFYTQQEVREIVQYAAARYVNVIPEIELPGHATAALAAYPQYSCTGGPFKVWTWWGVTDDIYCAGKEQTYRFLEDILSEVITIFPSHYIHIGGDEAPKIRWESCPWCQQRMRDEDLKDEHELQSYFVQRIEKFLNKNGREIIGWDEILEGGLAGGATIMSWRGTEGGIAAARGKHNVIMTPGSPCYFDHYQSNPEGEPFAFGGHNTLSDVYSFEPIPKELNKNQQKYILGAQGNVWTEYILSPEHVEYMAYPRAIALAEVNWSLQQNKDYNQFLVRLNDHFIRLDKLKVNYRKPSINEESNL